MTSLEQTFRDLEREYIQTPDKKKKVGNYVLDQTLGDGSFAKVRLGTHVLAQEKVAVKVITKKSVLLRDYLRKHLRREAIMLQKLCHPNIVHLFEVMETENCYYMVLELAEGGEFVKYLTKKKRLNEAETRKYMRQLVSAVDYIHQSGIVHRDIKLDNLLLDREMNIKLIDFGLSNFCQGDRALSTQCGSPAFAAPEIFSKRKYGAPVDVWSLGVNMYIMLTGRLPFVTSPPSNLTRLYAAMLRGCTVPDFLSPGCQDLIKRMLDAREISRATIHEISMNPWLTEGLTAPVQRYDSQFRKRKVLKENVISYLLKFVEVSETELRQAVLNQKANSLAAMYDLMLKRFEKGLEYPLPILSDVGPSRSSSKDSMRNGGFQSPGQDNNNALLELDTLNVSDIRQMKVSTVNPYIITTAPAISSTQGKNISTNQELPEKTDGKFLSDNLDVSEEPESQLERMLQLQKIFPMFQELQYESKGKLTKSRKGSEAKDILSFFENADEETFDRAIKLLKGYSGCSVPPVPPNSALEDHRVRYNDGVHRSEVNKTKTSVVSGFSASKPLSSSNDNLPPLKTPKDGKYNQNGYRLSALPHSVKYVPTTADAGRTPISINDRLDGIIAPSLRKLGRTRNPNPNVVTGSPKGIKESRISKAMGMFPSVSTRPFVRYSTGEEIPSRTRGFSLNRRSIPLLDSRKHDL